jgi:polyisoprenoid-binding protein YceI
MALPTGTYALGPHNAKLQVLTYREGVAARVGHDLVLDVTRWEAKVDVAADPAGSAVELRADPRSLEVREGRRGVKPLTGKDRAEIRRNIDDKVLHGEPIGFRSTAVRLDEAAGRLDVDGELMIAGRTRAISAQLAIDHEWRIAGTVSLAQSDWGIKPYRGLMGALKVRDEVELMLEARLSAE